MARSLLVLVMTLASLSTARADNISVGVFTPSATFPSTTARVELASRLGDHLGKALGGTGTGRVYARAGDFASAVKKGDVQVALVDATYLSTAGGGYTVIGVATRGARTCHSTSAGPEPGSVKAWVICAMSKTVSPSRIPITDAARIRPASTSVSAESMPPDEPTTALAKPQRRA